MIHIKLYNFKYSQRHNKTLYNLPSTEEWTLQTFARSVLRFEPLLLLPVVYVFWYADPNRLWSLLLLVPLLLLRWLAYGRLVTATPLNAVFAALLVLAVLNVFAAPYSRGDTNLAILPLNWQVTIPWAWVMLGRPLMGMAIYFSFVEHGRHYGVKNLTHSTVLLGLIVALLALFATQWNAKSTQLGFIIERLPQLREIWLAPGGFNANEIAGGIAWLTPLCAALMLHRWRPRIAQVGAAVAFALLLLALFLGQSRLAITGVIVALGFISLTLVPAGRRRALALAGLALFIAAEVAIVQNVFAPPTTAEAMDARDDNSAAGRLEMYISVIDILQDHPLTGVGMNMYRDGQVRADYPVPSFGQRILPHAHNELFQLGVDFGVPGLILFIMLHIIAGVMIWRCWRQPDAQSRAIAIGVAAALLAHGIFGLGDAVALWDRFIFVFWWTLGLLGAQYARNAALSATHQGWPAQSVSPAKQA